MSAIILKRRFNIDVSVVYSSEIGTIGVGEGSTEHWKEFMDFVGIDQQTLIRECDATYKAGVMFEGWSDRNYLHAVGLPFAKKFSQYNYVYANQISKNNQYLTPTNLWHNQLNSWFLDNLTEFPANQFHFNTSKLNDFLQRLAQKFDIKIYDDEIKQVLFNADGSVKSLIGKKTSYASDFYIDSTGFKRVLIGQMGAKWQSYGKYLKMKSAVVFPTGDEDNYNLWTLCKTMDHGWRFKTPVWGRHGNGYIFDSDYISVDQAKDEIDQEFKNDIQIAKSFKFDPGALDKAWIKNVVAIGLSSSFVEPLEASSIGTSIQQAFLLMHRLSNYDQKSINSYNKSFNDIMSNIRDFIILHYRTKKTNTQFWKDVMNLEIPDSLLEKLELWKTRLPIAEDFNSVSDYILFTAANYTLILEGLELFDRTAIKNEFNFHHEYLRMAAENDLQQQLDLERTARFIPHKKFIDQIRSLNL